MKTYRIYHPTKCAAILLLCMIVLAFNSCKDDDEVTVEGLSLNEEALYFTADGGSYTVKLSADQNWTVTSDKEWCMVSPANGYGSTDCEIRVDSSYLYQERIAHLNFRCGNYNKQLTINQLGYEKVIKLEKKEIEVADFTEYDEMFEEINVVSNVKYDIEVEYADPAQTGWVKVTRNEREAESIPRPTKVRIDYELYTSSDKDRIATIVFKQNDTKEGETPVVSRLTLRQTKAQEIIPSREGDSLALLAIVRIMRCYVNWDSSQSMIYWPNITLEEVEYVNQEGKTVEEMRVTGARFTVFGTSNSIPYQIRKLDQLRTLVFTGNENSKLKRIKLEDDVTYLPHLKNLGLVGFGITELPERMKEMTELEQLELSGNNLKELPIDIIAELSNNHHLEYVSLSNNRITDVAGRLNEYAEVKDTMGLHGTVPEELFKLDKLRYLSLSYNYFEGELPDLGYDASQYETLDEKIANNPVLPNMEHLSINLNFFTGRIPDWILYHKHLKCWDAYTLVFNQQEGGKNSEGKSVGFTNEPSSVVQPCELWEDEDEDEEEMTRANSFNASFKYPMEFDEANRRYPILSLEGGWQVNYIPMKSIK